MSLIFNFKKVLICFFCVAILCATGFFLKNYAEHHHSSNGSLPIIAIAQYGPHSSLDECALGIREELAALGYIDKQTVHIQNYHVNFDSCLIPQMLAKIKANKPALIVTLTTPVTLAAQNAFRNKNTGTTVSIVFSVVTDPYEAGIVDRADSNPSITGASDQQDLVAFLQFAKKVLPKIKTVGLLYSTAEANDHALVKIMKAAALKENIEVVAVPVDAAYEISLRMQLFKNKVDCIYVGASGPIQPSLPAIIHEADRMRIPVFNVDVEAVKEHQAFGSFAVAYRQVGINTALIIDGILKGKRVQEIPIAYPQLEDYQGYISQVKANQLSIPVLATDTNIIILK